MRLLVTTHDRDVLEQIAAELVVRKCLRIEGSLHVLEPEREVEDLLVLRRRGS